MKKHTALKQYDTCTEFVNVCAQKLLKTNNSCFSYSRKNVGDPFLRHGVHHHHHHHVRLLEVVKRNQHRAVAQYNSLIVD